MADTKKRMSEHVEMPSIRKSGSQRKEDIFSDFENSRKVLRDETGNGSGKMMFKNKGKGKEVVD